MTVLPADCCVGVLAVVVVGVTVCKRAVECVKSPPPAVEVPVLLTTVAVGLTEALRPLTAAAQGVVVMSPLADATMLEYATESAVET